MFLEAVIAGGVTVELAAQCHVWRCLHLDFTRRHFTTWLHPVSWRAQPHPLVDTRSLLARKMLVLSGIVSQILLFYKL